MKKKLRIFSMLLVGVILLAGCGKKDAFQEANKKMEQLDNYQSIMIFTIGAKSSGVSMEIPVTMKQQIDQKNKISKNEMSLTMMGMTLTSEIYVDERDSKNIITYTKAMGSDVWTKVVSTEEDSQFDINQLVSDKATKTSDKDGILTYEAELSKEDIENFIKEFGSSMESNSTDSDNFTVVSGAKAIIEIDKKTNYITKITLDLTSAIKMEQEGGELTTFKMEATFSEFNKVGDLTIDPSIISGALDEETEKVRGYAEDYIDAIEWEVMLEEDLTNYNNPDLEYDGPKPEKVEVTLVDNEVQDGIIVINGYTMEIKDGKVGTPTKK